MAVRVKQASDIWGVIPKIIMQDFMSLIASFSGKFYRLRGYDSQKKLLSKAGDYIEQKQK